MKTTNQVTAVWKHQSRLKMLVLYFCLCESRTWWLDVSTPSGWLMTRQENCFKTLLGKTSFGICSNNLILTVLLYLQMLNKHWFNLYIRFFIVSHDVFVLQWVSKVSNILLLRDDEQDFSLWLWEFVVLEQYVVFLTNHIERNLVNNWQLLCVL